MIIALTEIQFNLMYDVFSINRAKGEGSVSYEGKIYPYSYNYTKDYERIQKGLSKSNKGYELECKESDIEFIIEQLQHTEIGLLENNGDMLLSNKSVNQLSVVGKTIDYIEQYQLVTV